ncbi:hypothetical protein SDC9_79904 [bioreactor metagenome]|uniref:Uncharacterized protein n=1 Tax=bioreactor metagenome TaxID=1076179 RepID=A0A644YZS1_9ZZZZ
MNNCMPHHQFHSGETVVSLANHPPEIESGAEIVIDSPYMGDLYAVLLESGMLHRWFDSSELRSIDQRRMNSHPGSLEVGDCAAIISVNGHGSELRVGMVVKIAKVIPMAHYYDVRLQNGKYHRWLAEFEITYPIHYICNDMQISPRFK